MTDRLYRSPTDRVIAGVGGGLATWLNLDPSLVRVAWVLLAILSGGIFVLVYLVMMIVVPLPPTGWVPQPRRAAGPTWPGTGAWTGPAGSAAAAPGSPPPSESAPGSAWTAPPQPWVAPRVEPSNAGIVLGAVLVVLGAWFLVARYVNVDWDLIWPVVVIVLGVALIAGAMRRGRS